MSLQETLYASQMARALSAIYDIPPIVAMEITPAVCAYVETEAYLKLHDEVSQRFVLSNLIRSEIAKVKVVLYNEGVGLASDIDI